MEKERGLPRNIDEYKEAEGITLSPVEETLRDLEAYAEQEFRKPVTEEERKIHAESLEKSANKTGQARESGDRSAEVVGSDRAEELNRLNNELIDRFLIAQKYVAGDAELLQEYEQLIRSFRSKVEELKTQKPDLAEIRAVYEEVRRDVDDFIESNFGRK